MTLNPAIRKRRAAQVGVYPLLFRSRETRKRRCPLNIKSRDRNPKNDSTELLFERKSDLLFTSAYVGLMSTDETPDPEVYETLLKAPPPELQTWYFDHLHGALWIGVAGEHAEPLTDWLDYAHDKFRCTTMLAAALANGIQTPPLDAYLFTIPRNLVTKTVRRVLLSGFAVYLPHTDEFKVIVDPRLALSIRAELGFLPSPIAGLTRRPSVPPASGRVSQPGRYDPVEALFREVLGPVTRSARDAARELVKDWQEVFGGPVPGDLDDLRRPIQAEENSIRELYREVQQHGHVTAVISGVDRHARSLRKMRRTAFDLSARIRDYEWPPTHRATYDRVATPVMLRAIQRYTIDIARRLGITGYAFLPIVGRDFTTTTHSFESVPGFGSPAGSTTLAIEVPAEIRLRLGAMPVIAHEVVAAAMTDKLDEIGNSLVGLRPVEYPEIYRLLPKLRLRLDHEPDEDVQRHRLAVRRIGRQIGADLLACAAAGPPFIFALARFAAGTGTAATLASGTDEVLPLQTRLSLCIGLLNALGRPPGFISSYLPDQGSAVPGPVVDIVRASIMDECASEEEIQRIMADLRSGRVVSARPTAILEALWRGVAARSGYVHEIAALVSVANDD